MRVCQFEFFFQICNYKQMYYGYVYKQAKFNQLSQDFFGLPQRQLKYSVYSIE